MVARNYKSLCALIVEDAPMNAYLIAYLLQKKEFRTDYALNGKEAVNLVQRKYYDVVLMDVYMPVMNGLEATVLIRRLEEASDRRLPIIGLSASTDTKEISKILDSGMDDYLHKPLNPEALYEKVYQYCP